VIYLAFDRVARRVKKSVEEHAPGAALEDKSA
jgi:hypothetical protein